ncbi:MAG TPA: glucoamylase family protein [Planctomycetota bacterium]|nr:glucoamylase family protein [Planctomycetota bacterium]
MDEFDWTQLQQQAFRYFLDHTNAANGLVADTNTANSAASIAATGLGLSCYPVAVNNGWLKRADAAERVLTALRFFEHSPQGPEPDATGYKGFYYHFLDMKNGRRAGGCELSTVDSAFLLAGMLLAAAYFDADTPAECEIRATADALYRRADWQWALYGVACNANGWPTKTVEDVTIIHGGTPENGFISYRYQGYDETLLMHVLALGSATFALPAECYPAWQKTFNWRTFYDVEYVHMGSLFIHQLSHCWLDLRGIADAYMHGKGLDYFENSRRAVRVQRSYAKENPKKFRGYGPLSWGVSASDGPGPATKTVDNAERTFWMYEERGIPDGPDDGTLAPGAVAAALPFEPEIVTDTLRELVRIHPKLRSDYGLRASLNPTFGDWISPLNYGLDQGPIVMMIENHRTGLLWNLMRRCPFVWRGLKKAGFAGGWLDSERQPQCPKSVACGWREQDTPFSKLSETAAPSERADSHPTATMRAARIHSYGDPTGIKISQAARPEPGRGQVLIRVKAAGVNPLDWMIAEGKARSWIDHRLPLTLGFELAGVVEKLGAGAGHFKPGDEVFGMLSLLDDGADAEFAVSDENALALKPKSLDFPNAAAVPIGALTAYQALFDTAELRAGQTVFIHAAAGGVGSMAVQLAKARGARVIGTASGAEHIDLIRKLGCDEAIDYKATRFEDHVRDVDVVLVPVSGDSQSRSIAVLKKGGVLVTLTEEPRQDLAREKGVRAVMIGVKPDGQRLAEIAKLIDDGKLRPLVQKVLPLEQAKEALELSRSGHVAGKIVLAI